MAVAITDPFKYSSHPLAVQLYVVIDIRHASDSLSVAALLLA